MFMSNLINKYKRATPKQLVLSGVFMLALAGVIGLGFANRAATTAATMRDCDANSINRVSMNGGCGAANPAELVADARANNPSDLQTIYAAMGMSPSDYDAFAREAQQGTFFRDGHIEVNGATVATSAHSMGRYNYGNSTSIRIGSTTYWHGTPNQRWSDGTNSIPVMVWFNSDGTVRTAIMNPCGNPVPVMDKVVPKAHCDLLKATQPDSVNKPNTYTFTTNASFDKTTFSRVVYTIKEEGKAVKTVEKTSLTDGVTITFDGDAEVSATVYAKTRQGIEIKAAGDCVKRIKHVELEAVCEALIATAFDNNDRKFRFTVKTSQSNGVTVDSADFTLDGDITTKVTAKDDDGNFVKDYEFNDTKTHTVSVIVKFTAEGKTILSKEGDCVAEVTPKEKPVCVHNPKLPPDSPKCKPPVEECVPEGKEDENCELPSTGPAGVAGLVAGVTAAGAIGHRLFTSRRSRD